MSRLSAYGTGNMSVPPSVENVNGDHGTIRATDSAPFFELRGSLLDMGIFRDTLLPNLALHGGLSLIAYGAARANDKLEFKDVLWPTAQLANAWWSGMGRRMYTYGLTTTQAWNTLSRPEHLILTGVTVWAARLIYRLTSRASKRGQDDPRYNVMKKEEGFWNKALFKLFAPEALVQSLIALPFTAPFHHQGGVFTGYHPVAQSVAVGMFTAGVALEFLADSQLDQFKAENTTNTKMCKEGVWSVVRHPNYLGDALVHFSFPLLLYSSDLLAPVELLGSVANYLFLRYIGGVKQKTDYQKLTYSGEKRADFEAYEADENVNSFWPGVAQLQNKWTWIVVGIGAAGAVAETVIQGVLGY